MSKSSEEEFKKFGINFNTAYFVAYQNEIDNMSKRSVVDCYERLGVSNSLEYEAETGKTTSFYLGDEKQSTKPLSEFISGHDITNKMGNVYDIESKDINFLPAKNLNKQNLNLYTRQNAVFEEIFKNAKGFNVWITGTQICAGIKESKHFTAPKIDPNNMTCSTTQIYLVGYYYDVAVYCDPNFGWNDNRVIATSAVGETNNLKFMRVDELTMNAMTFQLDFSYFGGLL